MSNLKKTQGDQVIRSDRLLHLPMLSLNPLEPSGDKWR